MSEGHRSRILIVDDSKSIREELKRLLEDQGVDAEISEAANGLEGFRLLLDQPTDLVLCDLVMPQFDGFKFLQMCSTRPELAEVPVIMLTAIEDVGQKIRLLSSGASDYITKPFHPGELTARVKVHLKIKGLQNELRQKNALLLELSTTDGLTKIYNRRHFLELARKEFDRSTRMGLALSLLIFDVDHFKTINDTKGHAAGDDVLVALCVAVQGTLRDYDIFGRYGGDEFVVLLPQSDLAPATRVTERIEKAVREIQLPFLGEWRLGISGGLASKSPPYPDLESLLKAADDALYEAKTKGRGRIITVRM
jgi:two-component system cell cycle response regulator